MTTRQMKTTSMAARIAVAAIGLCLAGAAPAAIREEAVSYWDGDTEMKGFVVYDNASTAKRPGILVVHEMWGINQHMRDEAHRYAAQGYTAFVADLYGDGKTFDTAKEGLAMVAALKQKPALLQSRVRAAKDALAGQATVDGSRIGAAGYSFGGTVVLDLARADPDLKGAVVFYSSLVPLLAPAQVGMVKAKVLVLNGGADPFAKPDAVAAFNSEMTAAKADYRYVTYPEVKHAYSNPRATELGNQFNLPFAYSAEATSQADAEASKFFSETFRP